MREAGARDAVITGIGIVSSLGEGPDAHRTAFAHGQPVFERERFAPIPVHPLRTPDYDRMIPRRDQRQMEPWQRIGTHAAGLALEAAGLRGDATLLGQTHMLVAAGGGERNDDLDQAILAALPTAANPEAFLNERLMGGLRPTLFLAQLSNLLAGNISIVHGVVASSRTLMGEEAAGADAVRIACARIAAGQGELFLVGGAYNAERLDTLLLYDLGGQLWKRPPTGVWSRQAEGGGMIMGSLGCFLVLESRHHAEARSAAIQARIAGVATDRCRRRPGEASANARHQLAGFGPLDRAVVISGASGAPAPTAEEAAFLATTGLAVRASASLWGHAIEPSFIANLALAADVVQQGRLFPPLDAGEAVHAGPVVRVLVTGWGQWRGEAMALVEAP